MPKELSPKERMAIPRHKMPEREPLERIKGFIEVNLGYTPELAMAEAQRCLQCKKPLCVEGCPVNIDIPFFIKLIEQGEFIEAARVIKRTNALPAICGRVCPQEQQCEKVCVLAKRGEPVAIGHLERFVADFEREQGEVKVETAGFTTGKKAAVIGAGPAGLTVAGELAKKGHEVAVFEALHAEGGVLTYGIPEFRLPNSVLEAEVDYVRRLGVEFITNFVVGKSATLDDLRAEGYQAFFIGSGAGLPNFMGIEGENLNGIYSANEYLTRVNLMRAYLFPEYDTPVIRGKHVAVIGGGNTAMDAVRTAKRLGAERAMIVYRRSREEMPARVEEVKHAEEEGIEFHFLTAPVRYLGDQHGWVKAMECIRMELGPPDESGRRRPVPIEGSNFTMEVDVVVVAVGVSPNPLIPRTHAGFKLGRRGEIVVDMNTLYTNVEGVFAGGDIILGGSTVILAMGDGRRAAHYMDLYLKGEFKP